MQVGKNNDYIMRYLENQNGVKTLKNTFKNQYCNLEFSLNSEE